MLKFLKENGFACDLDIETKEEKESGTGKFINNVYINGKKVFSFVTKEFSDRKLFAKGFFEGVKFYGNKKDN